MKTIKYAFGLVWEKRCGKLLVVLQNIGAIIGVFPPIIYAVFPGLIINELIQNRRIPFGKEIDPEGIEPSGGEGQRIAIARACYHGGEIFILDEPTAALDPMAEYEIYTQFSNIITDKCAVLITHRLSAVQLADKVAVFDDGHVAEYGTHSELYAKGGIYTEMFDKQAKFYRDEPEQ